MGNPRSFPRRLPGIVCECGCALPLKTVHAVKTQPAARRKTWSGEEAVEPAVYNQTDDDEAVTDLGSELEAAVDIGCIFDRLLRLRPGEGHTERQKRQEDMVAWTLAAAPGQRLRLEDVAARMPLELAALQDAGWLDQPTSRRWTRDSTWEAIDRCRQEVDAELRRRGLRQRGLAHG